MYASIERHPSAPGWRGPTGSARRALEASGSAVVAPHCRAAEPFLRAAARSPARRADSGASTTSSCAAPPGRGPWGTSSRCAGPLDLPSAGAEWLAPQQRVAIRDQGSSEPESCVKMEQCVKSGLFGAAAGAASQGGRQQWFRLKVM